MFTFHQRDHFPPVAIKQNNIPQTKLVKYLGLHFGCKGENWKKLIVKEGKQMDLKTKQLEWLLENKLLSNHTVISIQIPSSRSRCTLVTTTWKPNPLLQWFLQDYNYSPEGVRYKIDSSWFLIKHLHFQDKENYSKVLVPICISFH